MPLRLLALCQKAPERIAFIALAPQLDQLVEQLSTYAVSAGIGLVQKKLRKFLLVVQQRIDIVFESEFRVSYGPIMSGANEGEKSGDQFESKGANRSSQSLYRAFGRSGLKEYHGRGGKNVFLLTRFRIRDRTWRSERTHPRKCGVELDFVGDAWSSQHLHNLLDRMRNGGGVAGWPAETYQKASVADDAIPYRAEPRKVDEQSLLEQGGQGIVEIARFREGPEFADQARGGVGRAKEIRQYPNSVRDLGSESDLNHCHVLARCYRLLKPLHKSPMWLDTLFC